MKQYEGTLYTLDAYEFPNVARRFDGVEVTIRLDTYCETPENNSFFFTASVVHPLYLDGEFLIVSETVARYLTGEDETA